MPRGQRFQKRENDHQGNDVATTSLPPIGVEMIESLAGYKECFVVHIYLFHECEFALLILWCFEHGVDKTGQSL